MSIYRKKNNQLIKLTNYVVQKYFDKYVVCTRTIENNIEYYDVPSTAIEVFSTFSANTIYKFKMPANTTTTPKLRYNNEVLDILVENDTLKVGQLEGIQELYTANVNETSKIYVREADKGYIDTELSRLSSELTYKVDKQFGNENETSVYGYTGVEQKTIIVSNTPQANVIPVYNEDGILKTTTPRTNDDCVNLQYLRNIANRAVGFIEQITLPVDNWVTDATYETYKYTNTVTLLHTPPAYTMLELLNDLPDVFAKYGFAILSAHRSSDSGYTSIKIGAVEQPTEGHILNILIKPTEGWVNIVW